MAVTKNGPGRAFRPGVVGLADLPQKRNEIAKIPGGETSQTGWLCGLFVLLVLSQLALAGCSPVEDPAVHSGSQIFRLPWPDGSGAYRLKDIELFSFRSPDRLEGDAAQIIVDPRVIGRDIEGEAPVGRWIRDGGRMIPADFVTLQGAVIYAHTEMLLRLDKSLGVASKYKRRSRIGLLSRLSEAPNAPVIFNNAIFDGRLDMLFFVPFSGKELPIAINAGIIAHEHFHRLFNSNVIQPVVEELSGRLQSHQFDQRFEFDIDGSQHTRCLGAHGIRHEAHQFALGYLAGETIESSRNQSSRATPSEEDSLIPRKVWNQVLLRGLNEGLADYWGWSYAQDEEFVGRSLGKQENDSRRLDRQAISIPTKLGFRNSLITVNRGGQPILKSEAGRIASAYRLGTEYARILRGMADASSAAHVRSALARSLTQIASVLAQDWNSRNFEPEDLLIPIIDQVFRSDGSTPGIATRGLSPEQVINVCAELKRLGANKILLEKNCRGAQ